MNKISLLNHFISPYDQVMGFRQQELKRTYQGLIDSDISLIAKSKNEYLPAGLSDDIGIYYWLPNIAQWFDISLAQAYSFFIISLLSMSLVLGIIGIILYFEKLIPRLIGIIVILLFFYKMPPLPDLNYAIPLFSVLSFIPLTLFFSKKPNHYTAFLIFLFFAGIIIGYFHYLRAFSSLSTIVIILFSLFLNHKISRKQKVSLLLAFIIGFSIPVLHFNYILDKRNEFLSQQTTKLDISQMVPRHPFWHSAYIGLGYYENNPYNLKYDDAMAMQAVQQIDPQVKYMSVAYGKILKHLYFEKVREHSGYYVKQLFWKAKEAYKNIPYRILLKIALLAALMTIIQYLFFDKKQNKEFINITIVFTLGIGTSLAPLLLVTPISRYGLDFYMLCYLYSIFGLVIFWKFLFLGYNFFFNNSQRTGRDLVVNSPEILSNNTKKTSV